MTEQNPTIPALEEGTNPPLHIWVAAFIAAVLHFLPFAVAYWDHPPDGTFFLKVGYNPIDCSAYFGLANHPGDWPFLLSNPFTCEPQGGRYIILYLSLLGILNRLTGLSLFTLFEGSRVVFIALFVVTAWRFLGLFLEKKRTRAFAMWLTLLSGGFGIFLIWLSSLFREDLQNPVLSGNSILLGWAFFNVLHNPLWILGFIFLILFLHQAIRPDASVVGQTLKAAAWLILLFFNHPYSGIAAVAIFLTWFACSYAFSHPEIRARLTLTVPGFLLGGAVVGMVGLWQRGDSVYRFTSGGIFGDQATSPFWYPVTLGLVGIASIFGIRQWIFQKRPELLFIIGWFVVIVFLHSSPILNGYHFVLYLYFPLCVVAAAPLESVLDRFQTVPLARIAILSALFGPTLLMTYEATNHVYRYNRFSSSSRQSLEWLKGQPSGNVLCDSNFGVLVPVFTNHRVWCGHWFMTVDYPQKSRKAKALLTGNDQDLRRFLRENSISYLVIPVANLPSLTSQLVGEKVGIHEFGNLVVLDFPEFNKNRTP